MFAKTNYFFVAFLCLFLSSIVYTQIAPPPGRGAGGSSVRRPPPDLVDVIDAVPQNVRGERQEATISRRDRKLTEPEAADIAKFQALLNKPGYGIVKLLNSRCSKEATNIYVVSAVEGCANSLPGNGAYFSFRRREYTAPPVSDIKIKEGKFIVGSSFTQGLIVSLGENDVEKIEINTTGIKYIVNFKPASEIEGAQKQTAEIKQGITEGGYFYSGSADVKENQAYILRSIAYRVGGGTGDKRRDVIIAFQVVRQDENGNVTLVWKELQNKEPPKLDQKK